MDFLSRIGGQKLGAMLDLLEMGREDQGQCIIREQYDIGHRLRRLTPL